MARASTRSNARARPDNSAAIGATLLIVLLIPRVIRLFYPEVWVEDDFYLESAWLVSIGMRPYLDFVHPHMPLLEWFAGLYIWLFGASHFRIEILNEAAIYFSSLLVFKLAVRAAGRRAAVCAAILYAFSSLVFRYHVYERECFVAPLILLAVLCATGNQSAAVRRGAAIAVLVFLACAVKLTAVIPAAVLLLYLAIGRRRLVEAILIGVAITVLLAAFSAFLYWRYGFQFLFQVFLFHFMKGRDLSATPATYPAQVLDLLAPLFVLGCVATILARRVGRELALVFGIVVASYLFFGVLSPTAWGHNYLEPLPYIAIVAGVGLEAIVSAIAALVTAADSQSTTLWAWAIGGPLVIIIALATVTPLMNQNWLHGSVYGFGYISRGEIERLANALDAASPPGSEVIAPAFICFQAHRIEMVRYPETYGVLREAETEFARDGFRKARAHLGNAGFFALIGSTSHFWSGKMRAAIAAGTVPAVILDSPWQMLPIVGPPTGISPRFLLDSGYQPTLRTAHFILWQPAAGGGETMR